MPKSFKPFCYFTLLYLFIYLIFILLKEMIISNINFPFVISEVEEHAVTIISSVFVGVTIGMIIIIIIDVVIINLNKPKVIDVVKYNKLKCDIYNNGKYIIYGHGNKDDFSILHEKIDKFRSTQLYKLHCEKYLINEKIKELNYSSCGFNYKKKE